MPLPVCQNLVNLIAGFPIWRPPETYRNAAIWDHCNFDNEIFRYVNIYYSNSIIITNFMSTFIS
jgi:hypothetical protein